MCRRQYIDAVVSPIRCRHTKITPPAPKVTFSKPVANDTQVFDPTSAAVRDLNLDDNLDSRSTRHSKDADTRQQPVRTLHLIAGANSCRGCIRLICEYFHSSPQRSCSLPFRASLESSSLPTRTLPSRAISTRIPSRTATSTMMEFSIWSPSTPTLFRFMRALDGRFCCSHKPNDSGKPRTGFRRGCEW
jgi:hypothetical protein